MRKFYSRILLSLFLLTTAILSKAQTVDLYGFSTGTGTTIDPMTGATQAIGSSVDDDPSGLLPIGFTFNYEGTSYTNFSVTPDGFMTLGVAATSQFTNTLSSTTNIPKIMAFWDDLATGTNGAVRYKLDGTAPNRILKVEWFVTVPRNTSGAADTRFQIWLYESTNNIEIRYGATGGTTTSATVGLRGAQNSTTVYKFQSVTTATHTSSTTTPNDLNTAYPGAGRIYIFQAPLPCVGAPNPGTIAGSNQVCASQTTTLSISGQTVATGLTYQWLSSTTAGGPYTPIAGATGQTYTTAPTTQTTYYVAQVICSGNIATTPQFTVSVPALFPGGVYTIGGPAGPNNFTTFTAAVNAIACGISGPVTFNVTTATYNEQIAIPAIGNTSSTNTVTFNGNGATLQSSPTAAAPHGILLNGADWIRIDSLNVNVASGTSGWGIVLTGQADNNIIRRSVITTNATSTSTTAYMGIYVNGSATGTAVAGNSGSNNLFELNTVNGGYNGIYLLGPGSTPYNTNNIVRNNRIVNPYLYGIYANGQTGIVISGNDISMPGRTTTTTTSGIYIGTNTNILVDKNRIHDYYNANNTSTSTFNGISINVSGTLATPNTVSNNVIYNIFNRGGVQNGILVNVVNYWRVLHNTVVLDDPNATSTGVSSAFQIIGTNNTVRNNIASISRGGTGTKRLYNYSSTTPTGSVIDNNVFHFGTTTGTLQYAFLNSAFTTLAAWKASNSAAYDQQSIEADPQFLSVATGNLLPLNGSVATAGGAAGVTTDIVNTPRNASTPTPGAYEVVPPQGIDLGVMRLVSPVQKNCYSATETVSVKIRNYSANAHNFTTTPVTVTASVTGPNATTFTPVVISTGTLASGDSLEVVISNAYNMSAAGNYVFTATATAAGDVTAANNAMQSTTRTAVALTVGTVSATPGAYCVTGGTPTLTLANSAGGNIQWQSSATGAPGSWTNVGTNSTTYTPATAITATTYYRAYATCNANNDTSAAVTVTLNAPQLISSAGGTRCGPGQVILTATANAGSTLNWYTSATGGVPVGTGALFTTPIISSNTTYYVAAASGGSSATVGLSPTAANCGTLASVTSSDWPLRFNTTAPVTINSVTVIPVAAGTFTVALRNSLSTANITSQTFTFTAAEVGIPKVLTLGWSVPTSGTYQLTNSTGGVYRIGTFTCNYPFTSPSGSFSIVGSATTSGSATSLTQYNGFFNINISEGCETPRQAVTATITAPPALGLTSNVTICNNATLPLTVTTPIANFNNYTWSPATNLYTTPNLATPYTAGTNDSTVYVKTNVGGTYTYVLTAFNSATSCQNIDSVKVTVLPGNITISPSASALCVSGTSTLTLNPGTGYGAGSFQWYTSPNGSSYTPITNAIGGTYTTPTITATTYYKVDVKDGAGNVCTSPTTTIAVNSPQVVTTTPAALCGPGVMTLGATGSTGTTIRWYAAPTGGTPLAVGNSYTTPNLTATTTYYAAAETGVPAVGAGGTTSTSYESPYYHLYGGKKSQYLFLASELQGLGLTANQINSLAFNVTAAGTSYNNFSISLKNTTATAMTTTLQTGLTTVYTAASVTPTVGLNNYPFITAFQWDGTSNVIVEVCWSNNNFGGTSSSVQVDATPFVSHAYYRADNETSASLCNQTIATATQSLRPQVFFNNTAGYCPSPRVAVVAQVSGVTTITQQPVPRASCVGGSVSLSVTATGANLTYQWRKNGVNVPNTVPGYNQATLTFNPVQASDAGLYDVVITGLCGNQTSTAVNLVVATGNSWIGVVNNDWNNAQNWCGGVPTATTDVTIPANTPFAPNVSFLADVRNLPIATGATLSIASTGTLNAYGNLANSGTVNAPNGLIIFKGATNQSAGGFTVGTMLVNGAGVTLSGNVTVSNNLILTNGNITLGTNNLTLNRSIVGTAASHIVTNGTGGVISNNITTSQVIIPVGPDAASYNPVTIYNGQGRNYSVRVATGINPSAGVLNPARAINRTWTITPSSTVTTPVDIILQYSDADATAPASPTLIMEAGVHNGTNWNIVSPATGITPSGLSTARQAGISTTQFGPTIIGNIGTLSFPLATPNVDPDVQRVVLMPNLVQGQTVLRLNVRRSMKVTWSVIDGQGRVVTIFQRSAIAGQNDYNLNFSNLAAGQYLLIGNTEKGKTQLVKFIRQ